MNDTAAILQAVRDGDMPVVERLLTADPRLVQATITSKHHSIGPLNMIAATSPKCC